jgi:hypothetical protein
MVVERGGGSMVVERGETRGAQDGRARKGQENIKRRGQKLRQSFDIFTAPCEAGTSIVGNINYRVDFDLRRQ